MSPEPRPPSLSSSPSGGSRPSSARPGDQGLSLEDLGAAFAEMLGAGADPYLADASPSRAASAGRGSLPQSSSLPTAAGQNVSPPLSGEPGRAGPAAAAGDPCPITPKSILEAMLFVGLPGHGPLAPSRVAGLMRGVRGREIEELAAELNEQYAVDGCPYQVESQAEGFRLVLRSEFRPVAERVSGRARHARLSQAAIEVLAAVAYHEPLARDEVDRLRGRPSGAILAQLVRRRLLSVERSSGRPPVVRYRTTPRFLELFGIERLEDLPRGPNPEPR